MSQLSPTGRIGRYRWRIAILLFFATTINYIDRNVFSLVMIDQGFKEYLVSWAAEGQRIGKRTEQSPETIAWLDDPARRSLLLDTKVMSALTNDKKFRDETAISGTDPLTPEQEAAFHSRMDESLRTKILAAAPSTSAAQSDALRLSEARKAANAINAWLKNAFSLIDAMFKAGYALGFLLVGSFLDRVGVRVGMASALVVWSLSALAHAICRPLWSFCVVRFTLGVGESGNFPGAVKATGEWFPKKERALANGLFNAGANVGIILVYIFIPLVLAKFGWQYAFLFTAALQALWLVYWFKLYRSPEDTPQLSKEELAHIRSDPPEPPTRIPWLRLLGFRQTWAFVVGKTLCDPVWYFYLVWLPTFFAENNSFGDQKLDLKSVTIPFLIIYIVSDIGSVAGGWFSSKLMSRGWTANAARKTTMLICALGVIPIFMTTQTSSIWFAVGLVALGTAAHQANSANLFSIVGDMFPRHATASVTGIGGFFGSVAGTLVAFFTGMIVLNFGYEVMFIYASSAYLVGFIIIHILVPRLDPVSIPDSKDAGR